MTKHFFIDALLWGFVLWLVGYILGIILFAIVPSSLIGFVIMPIGIAVAVLVLVKKVKLTSLQQYVALAIVWVTIAIVCDYFLLVKVFKPTDGYYKLDVYLYYALTFALPMLVGLRKFMPKF